MKFLRIVTACTRSLRNLRHLSFTQGQWLSIRDGTAVDADGLPIPWYTYPAIEFLRSFDFSESAVFEYGAGNSSIFWSRLARNLVSVEDNQDWCKHVRTHAAQNQVVLLRPDEDAYVAAIADSGGPFDVVAIDGRWRLKCAKRAIEHLTPRGIVLLDNSDWHPETSRFLRECGLFQIDFNGFGPINAYCWTTSVFVRGNADLQRNFRDPSPRAGIRHRAE